MTLPTNEGNLEAVEGGRPTQTLTADSQPSSDLTKLQSRLDALDKKQAELDASYRAIQSDKDRGVKKVQADVERINKVLAMKEKGLDQEEILHRLRVEELYDKQTPSEPVAPTPSVGTGVQDTYLAEVMGVVKESGLEANDPEVLKLMVNRASEAEYLRLALRKKNSPTPEDAGAPPIKPQGIISPENNDELVAKLAQYQKNPTKYAKEIEEATRKLGW